VAHARLVARAGVRTLAQTAGTLLVLAAVASVALLVIGPALGLYRTVTVLSGSMTPTFSPGDVIVVTPQPASTLRVGEVITYQIPVENEPVETHRVMQILEHGREPIVRTKGDANRTRDPWTARLHGGTVWRYRFRVPALGYALLELRQPLVRRLLVLVPTLVLLGFGLARVWLPVPRRDVRPAPSPRRGRVCGRRVRVRSAVRARGFRVERRCRVARGLIGIARRADRRRRGDRSLHGLQGTQADRHSDLGRDDLAGGDGLRDPQVVVVRRRAVHAGGDGAGDRHHDLDGRDRGAFILEALLVRGAVDRRGLDEPALGDCAGDDAEFLLPLVREHEQMFASGIASILHADLDSFFASVEQRDDPRLRGRPVVVGAGVVLAASYEAKACGVRTAMGVTKARALCPDAVFVPPRFSAYSEASKAVFEIFDDTTPVVEGLSIDEAFLDTRGMERAFGTPLEIAAKLRRTVRERVGLPITVGVARTKFLAKVASAVAKPDGLLVVPPERELAFLQPLPVERLWGVGPVTARKLRERGLGTVRDVAVLPEPLLVSMLGKAAGRHLHALAHNLDPRPVHVGRRRGSIGSQRARGLSRCSFEEAELDLVMLVDRVTRRLRAADRIGRTVVLRLRFADYRRATRSQTLPHATASTQAI